jgi:hypothetical protein
MKLKTNKTFKKEPRKKIKSKIINLDKIEKYDICKLG